MNAGENVYNSQRGRSIQVGSTQQHKFFTQRIFTMHWEIIFKNPKFTPIHDSVLKNADFVGKHWGNNNYNFQIKRLAFLECWILWSDRQRFWM